MATQGELVPSNSRKVNSGNEFFKENKDKPLDSENLPCMNEARKAVGIINIKTDTGTSYGTGFLVADGYLITAYHVLRETISNVINDIEYNLTYNDNTSKLKNCKLQPLDFVQRCLKRHQGFKTSKLLISLRAHLDEKEFEDLQQYLEKIWTDRCSVTFPGESKDQTHTFKICVDIPFASEDDDVLILKVCEGENSLPEGLQLHTGHLPPLVDIYGYRDNGLQISQNCSVYLEEQKLTDDIMEAEKWWCDLNPKPKVNINSDYQKCSWSQNAKTGCITLHASQTFVHGTSGAPIIFIEKDKAFVTAMYLKGNPAFYYNKQECYENVPPKYCFETAITMKHVAELMDDHPKIEDIQQLNKLKETLFPLNEESSCKSQLLYEVEDYRFLIFGVSGNGKSAFAKLLTSSDKFISGVGPDPVTTDPVMDIKLIEEKACQVVDTCGASQENIRSILCRSMYHVLPGPHIIFYVVNGSKRFGPEEAKAYKEYKKFFEGNILQYTVPVFTHLDVAESGGKTRSHLEKATSFQAIINDCNGRKIFVNNNVKNENKIAAIKKIALSQCQDALQTNNGIPLTATCEGLGNAFLDRAQKILEMHTLWKQYVQIHEFKKSQSCFSYTADIDQDQNKYSMFKNKSACETMDETFVVEMEEWQTNLKHKVTEERKSVACFVENQKRETLSIQWKKITDKTEIVQGEFLTLRDHISTVKSKSVHCELTKNLDHVTSGKAEIDQSQFTNLQDYISSDKTEIDQGEFSKLSDQITFVNSGRIMWRRLQDNRNTYWFIVSVFAIIILLLAVCLYYFCAWIYGVYEM